MTSFRNPAKSAAPAAPADRPIHANAQPENAHLFASDGRPFVDPPPANPPAPGGKWPGTAASGQETKAYSVVLELTREALNTAEKRELVAQQIMDSGVLGRSCTRMAAWRIASTAWDEIEGKPLDQDTKAWISEYRELIQLFNRTQADLSAAARDRETQDRLNARRAKAEARLANYRTLLGVADGFNANPLAALDSAILDGRGSDHVFWVGNKLSGAREISTILRDKAIPAAEAELAAFEKRTAG